MKTSVDKDDLLEYLSGEAYKEQSTIYSHDTKEFLKELTGVSQSTLSIYLMRLEEYFTLKSKAAFKYLGLAHWDERVKIAMFMIVVIVPFVIALVFAILAVIFQISNMWFKRSHESEIKSLRAEEMQLIE